MGTGLAEWTLFGSGPVAVRSDVAFQRTDLGDGAWVDVARGALSGCDELADRLLRGVDWQHFRRWLYDRMVDEPRVSRFYSAADPLPDPGLADFRTAMGGRYGVAFGAMGLNLYRDGRDSVAAHGDVDLRNRGETLVAILTLGAIRPFMLKPTGGGRSVDLHPASGDIIVMGGTCQRTWQHGVPKVSRPLGPRISASIRWAEGYREPGWRPRGRTPSGAR